MGQTKGGGKERPERTTIQVSLSTEDKKLLKKYAADRGTTVAAVVHGWVSEHCAGESLTGGRRQS